MGSTTVIGHRTTGGILKCNACAESDFAIGAVQAHQAGVSGQTPDYGC
jgi:hypothetical protein